ncbi:PEP/pyruvate-binding domain-containing protein [Ideonella margarita]|uniref:PEP/pyruvate-binding domain-containing protein n=1 Tax=Ideonella margarita TaxID=2984191 RepID=A0ABU9C6P1_9BURK
MPGRLVPIPSRRLVWLAASVAFAVVASLAGPAHAQLAEKPSGYRSIAPRPGPISTPAGATPVPAGWLPRIGSRVDADRLARVMDAGTPLALPHLLFLIDRGRGNQVQYIDSRRYALHQQFLQARDGLTQIDERAFKANYRSPQRRHLFGTLAWQSASQAWTFEFWEGDQLDANLLRLARQSLQDSFYALLRFKPNSQAQQAVGETLGVPMLAAVDLIREQGFLPLNVGRAVGRLRVVADADAVDDLAPDDIVLLDEVPLGLPPVAGVITARPSTTLSHVNLLARGWGIPNAWVLDTRDWRSLAGEWVRLDVARTGVTLVRATEAERAQAGQVLRAPVTTWPAPELRRDELVPLARLGVADRRRCGAKAANLGALTTAWQRGAFPGVAPVPDGFCIPFGRFAAFMAQPAAREALARAQATPGFATDRRVRAEALATLRQTLLTVPLPEGDERGWLARWQQQLGGDGVFVRSSSNSEDLPGFSGAGLYTTVPNVTRPEALADAVRTVWASVWNADAWEARRWAGVPQDSVVMGVLVQRAVAAQSSGVLATINPFDPQRPGLSYVSAKRGLGIRVVEGKRQAEQVLYHHRSHAVQVLSRSEDPVALLLDAAGGVREEAQPPGRAVLTDALVRGLAETGQRVQRLLGPAPQDIEWATDPQGRIVLLQARPLVQAVPGVAPRP